MHLGVDYYPEQWPEEMLDEDLAAIVELGADTIRIGEFTWGNLERSEGIFDFSSLDRVIARAKAHGLQVVLGTPTATMPAWLAARHPEVLSENENGCKRSFGGRRLYCFNSPVYQFYSRRLVRAMAEHFCAESAIVAWQIDNELGHEGSDLCWCGQCRAAFQQYLKGRYPSIGALNAAWGTVFWDQQYDSFDQIGLPLPTITAHNPSMRLEHERFRAESVLHFARMQYDAIKEVIPGAVIFHDFPGGALQKHYDYSSVAQNATDVVAYNNYPVWGGQERPLQPFEIAFGLDLMRGLRRQNFWISEAIMGAQGHDLIGYLPRPNQARLWSFQGMLHGCSSLLYFRYRSAAKGAEQYCCGILDADNIKRRRWYESQAFFREARSLQDVLESPMTARVCILYSYDSAAAWRIQPQSRAFSYEEELKRWYRPLYARNLTVDILPAGSDLQGYALVLAPNMIVQDPAVTGQLRAYVAGGGTLVLTYRSFAKDLCNNFRLGQSAPFAMTDVVGCVVEESESLPRGQAVPVRGQLDGAAVAGHGTVLREMLGLTTAKALLHYADPLYEQVPALCENEYGRGHAFYAGFSPDDAVLEPLMERLLALAGIAGVSGPEGVEIVRRRSADRTVTFYLNHTDRPVAAACGLLEPYQCRWQAEPV